MPTRVVPDDETLREWHKAGMSYRAMSDLHFENTGRRATPAAFNIHCRRIGLDLRNDRCELIPWSPIRPEHDNKYVPNMLRREAARRRGKVFSERELNRLNSWIARLNAGNGGKGVVITYNPDTEKGWIKVKRVPSDTDIIRMPKQGPRKTVQTKMVKPTKREKRLGD